MLQIRRNYALIDAVADRVDRTDGCIDAGAAAFSSAGANFQLSDEGKLIYIDGAGGNGDNHLAVINDVNSPTSVTLSCAAGTPVQNTAFSYGTDAADRINYQIGNAGSFVQDSSIGALVEMDAGGYLLASPMDLHDKHGLHFRGAGAGAASIKAFGNFPLANMAASQSAILTKLRFGGVTLLGGGMNGSNAHGIAATWTNHCALYDLLFKRCNTGVWATHVWQFAWDWLKATGKGSDQNLDCYYLGNTSPTFEDNAVVASHVYGEFNARDGFRMENPQGTKLVNVEFGGCGRDGFSIGNPSVGSTKSQWLIASNCLADSCGRAGWNFSKGASSTCGQHQLSNVWGSNCQNGFYFESIEGILLSNLQAHGNTQSAVIFNNCLDVILNGIYAKDNNEANAPTNATVRFIGTGNHKISNQTLKSIYTAAPMMSFENGATSGGTVIIS